MEGMTIGADETRLLVRNKLLQILEHSMNTNFSATEHSVEEYIEMVESRQILFDDLAALAPQGLKDVAVSLPDSPGNLKLGAEIKDIVRRIAAREEHHNKQAEGMMMDLRKGLKGLNT